jgi:hypothetical protein
VALAPRVVSCSGTSCMKQATPFCSCLPRAPPTWWSVVAGGSRQAEGDRRMSISDDYANAAMCAMQHGVSCVKLGITYCGRTALPWHVGFLVLSLILACIGLPCVLQNRRLLHTSPVLHGNTIRRADHAILTTPQAYMLSGTAKMQSLFHPWTPGSLTHGCYLLGYQMYSGEDIR